MEEFTFSNKKDSVNIRGGGELTHSEFLKKQEYSANCLHSKTQGEERMGFQYVIG